MGCDIHSYIEYKKNGQWKSESCYIGRDYALFGLLAGVRGVSIKPIAEERGLPPDVTKRVQQQSNAWDGDGHSHSYVTLEELLELDWGTKKVKADVYFSEYLLHHTDPRYYPLEQCGSDRMGLTPTAVISRKEADKIISEYKGPMKDIFKDLREKFKDGTSVKDVEWSESIKDKLNTGFMEIIATMVKFAKYGPVRLVFWFDN